MPFGHGFSAGHLLHSRKEPNMHRSHHLSIALIAIFGVLLLTGCDSYYFARPQPADRKDERNFPRAMQGRWIDVFDNEESGSDVILSDSLQTIYSIDRQRIWTFEASSVTVLDRTLTLETAEQERAGEGILLPSMREQRYDSCSGRMDTIDHFILYGDRIHPVEDDRLMKGYPFTRRGDTIFFTQRDTTCMELGHHLNLRKASRDLFVLNIRDGASKEAKGWWEVLLVRPSDDGLDVFGAGKRLNDHPAMVYKRSGNHYLDLDLRSDELELMIRDSVFVQGMRLVRDGGK
jgi:hypothetical protein